MKDIMGCSRLVTLPDWQGLGLAMALIDTLGAAYKAVGKRVHTYPAHPGLIRSFDKSRAWKLEKKPGLHAPADGAISSLGAKLSKQRPCAVFEYAGGVSMDRKHAELLLES